LLNLFASKRGRPNSTRFPCLDLHADSFSLTAWERRGLAPEARPLSKHSLASQRICSRPLVMRTGARARWRSPKASESFAILPERPSVSFLSPFLFLPKASLSFPDSFLFKALRANGREKRKKKKSRLLRADPEQGRRKRRAPERSRLEGHAIGSRTRGCAGGS
jgi:hypothetical protein